MIDCTAAECDEIALWEYVCTGPMRSLPIPWPLGPTPTVGDTVALCHRHDDVLRQYADDLVARIGILPW